MAIRKNKSHIIDTISNRPPSEVYLILDNIRSILNVGAIFRTADAAGIKKIYLCGITAYPSNKIIRLIDKVDIVSCADIIGDRAIIKYNPSHECVKSSLESLIAKTALKALGEVEFEYKTSTLEAIRELKENNINIVALEQAQNSIDYRTYPYNEPLAIIVGNEVNGVEKEALDLCDAILEIPMHGHVNSLNVSTAAGIILFKAAEAHEKH